MPMLKTTQFYKKLRNFISSLSNKESGKYTGIYKKNFKTSTHAIQIFSDNSKFMPLNMSIKI